MAREIEIRARAEKELSKIPKRDATRIAEAILALQGGLKGDIKKLTNHEPAYRLRVGDWRVLFDILPEKIVIQTIKNRRDAY
ncbi:MAG: type II toxin-antitoxin system RelE/ParE family toxin [Verrucomicrobiaceae bacterium]